MFLPIIFIILGLLLLLNAFGIAVGNIWGIFWAIVFLALGIKMIMRRMNCPMCGLGVSNGKLHERIHAKYCNCEQEEVKKEPSRKQK